VVLCRWVSFARGEYDTFDVFHLILSNMYMHGCTCPRNDLLLAPHHSKVRITLRKSFDVTFFFYCRVFWGYLWRGGMERGRTLV
jgi:hypothetical protein